MVPFAEMLNHECSDVYYDFVYNPDNPNKSKESEYPEPKVILLINCLFFLFLKLKPRKM